MKARLLVFTSTFPRWKDDTDPPFVFELCRRLSSEFDVFVITPHYPGALAEEAIEDIQVRRFRYFFPNFEKLAGSVGILPTLRHNKFYYMVVPFFLIAGFFSLLRATMSVKPDLIHAHWLVPQGFAAYIVNLLTRRPYIATAHGADVFGLQKPIFRKARLMVQQSAFAVTAVSNSLKDKLDAEYGEPDRNEIIVLPMGVDSTLFDTESESEPEDRFLRPTKILFVGRLTEKKGVSYLIKAMPALVLRYPEIHLTVVGSGELAAKLEKEVADLGINSNVIFIGAIPNNALPSFYRRHSIFIGPSIEADGGDTEGFGLTFVEAAMSGCLLIGTDVGGIKDIIIDGVTGFLVKQRNSNAITEKVIYALENRSLVREMVKKGSERCKAKYDWKIIADQYSQIYQRAISENRK